MLTVLYGLLGLSIVVVVHELGHFFAARAFGVDVEVFSIGWGPRLFGFTRKGTEWRISAFPLGGFCRMKGEEAFRSALENKLPHIPGEKGSFYAAAPWRRILILLAGPFFNALLAFILYVLVSLVGIKVQTAPNRIVLASEVETSSSALASSLSPAEAAGLRTGDFIASIDGKPMRDYSDIQEAVGFNPGAELRMGLLREGHELFVTVRPRLDKNSGQGLIGVFPWIDPLVEKVEPEGAAAIAGLQKGDRIGAIDEKPIRNTMDIMGALSAKPELISLSFVRGGETMQKNLVVSYGAAGQANLGLAFAGVVRTEKASGLSDAIARGGREVYATLVLTIKGIGLLFNGVNILKAVSGPARITYMVGSATKDSIAASGLSGIPPVLSFLAFLSLSLFLMNLLPIPALDGGQMLLSLTEMLRRRPLLTKTIYRFQFIGSAMIIALLLLAVFSDVLFFAGK